jgi:hypothetical protein
MDLPQYVTQDERKGTCYRPYLGRVDGKIKWGKRVRLGPHDMPIPNVWEALENSGICPVATDNFVPFPTLSASHRLNQLWTEAKKNARKRGISFEIGKQDWYEWWGDDIFKRGKNGGDLQMCRFKDEGAYRLDNIYKATQKRNLLDAYHNRVRARLN